MNTWLTSIQIKPEHVDDFMAASALFSNACMREIGLVSFALLQQKHDSTQFSLFDVYHNDLARENHLASDHFLTWQNAIAPMLVNPIEPALYDPIFPPPEDWEQHLEL